MHENLGATEDLTRAKTKGSTDRLLSSLRRHHDLPDDPPIEKQSVPVVVHPEVAEPIEVCVLPIEGAAPTIDAIKRVVCRHFGLSHHQLISERRSKDVVYPRQIAMYLCRQRTTVSLPQVGRRFSGRDHTTIIHAARKIAKLIVNDQKVASDVAQIEAQL